MKKQKSSEDTLYLCPLSQFVDEISNKISKVESQADCPGL